VPRMKMRRRQHGGCGGGGQGGRAQIGGEEGRPGDGAAGGESAWTAEGQRRLDGTATGRRSNEAELFFSRAARGSVAGVTTWGGGRMRTRGEGRRVEDGLPKSRTRASNGKGRYFLFFYDFAKIITFTKLCRKMTLNRR
jgi:hypothetical protein